MSITKTKFYDNIDTIRINRYGSEIREAIHENFEYLGSSGNNMTFVKCTQEEYDEMESHDSNTLYFIV